MPRSPAPAAKRAAPVVLEIEIASMAPGGDGLAHVVVEGERRAFFIPQTAPGDRVRVEVELDRRPARGRVIELLDRGPGRVTPACSSAHRCGGCDWMHLSAEEQALWRTRHLRAVLPAVWQDVSVVVHPAPQPLGYRSRARVHVRCEQGRVVVGMHEARSHEPVEVDACVVLGPAVEGARRSLALLLQGSQGRGEVQIALGAQGRPVLDVRWRGEVAAACFGRLERACMSGELAGAQVTLLDASRPATIGDPTPWTLAADGRPLRLAPGGFAQANPAVNGDLALHVEALGRGLQVEKVTELYAGSGNFSVLLARHAADLVVVESSREACDAARANLAARELRARVVEADADAYAWSAATKLVVLDPPRTGARSVTMRLRDSRVAHVIYVSCDLATLGRDLAVLAESYDLRSLHAFEMFPQTSHLETVAALERRRT